MTDARATTAQDATATQRAPAVPEAPEERTLVDRLRGYLPWIGGAIIIIVLFGTLKWWGDQQQHAALRGRSWPPEPIKVFLRG
jgi:hypothetical protein